MALVHVPPASLRPLSFPLSLSRLRRRKQTEQRATLPPSPPPPNNLDAEGRVGRAEVDVVALLGLAKGQLGAHEEVDWRRAEGR